MVTCLLHTSVIMKPLLGRFQHLAGYQNAPLLLALPLEYGCSEQETVFQLVKTRSLRCLPNLGRDHSLLEACPVAPINPKTHLGSPWSNQNPRRRKPLPLPQPDWQLPQTQALCPLLKERTPEPARPLRPPTRLTMMTMKITRWRRKRCQKEVRYQLQSLPLTHGTASPGQLIQEVQKVLLVEEAHPALPALEAARARNGRHLQLHGHLQETKFSLPLSPPLALPLQL